MFDRAGAPAGALTGVESRFNGDRTARPGMLLLEAAHALTRRIARRG
ncbi:hypothetical protein [Actinoplanes xinjiangensis]